jgi:hypothetical protein
MVMAVSAARAAKAVAANPPAAARTTIRFDMESPAVRVLLYGVPWYKRAPRADGVNIAA